MIADAKLMLSLFKKEVVYAGGLTMSDVNACSLLGFTGDGAAWSDELVNDKDQYSREFGSKQELVERRSSMNVVIPQASPNDLSGLAALALGNIATTQDGALTAYKHRITPLVATSALPSIQAEEKRGTIQYAYAGVKADTLKISGEAGKFLSVEAGLIGSGQRTLSATAFAASITESWMRVNQMKVWLESGVNLTIGAPVQGVQNISSGTPRDLKVYMKSFSIDYNNNLEQSPGFGGGQYLQSLDHKRRAISLNYSMLFSGQNDIDNYLNQTPLAIEFDVSGALIAAGGTYLYGAQIILPKIQTKKAPLPKGGPSDLLTADFECEVLDDGSNGPILIDVYNAVPAYLV